MNARIVFTRTFSHTEPKDFLQSQWQKNEKSIFYLIYRWIVAMFFIYAVMYAMFLKIVEEKFILYFVYMTNLNLTGTAITTTFGAILVTLFHYEKLQIQNRMIKRMKIYWWLWNQSLVLSWIVSIFFWMDFVKEGKPISEARYVDILTHVLNCIIPTLDLFIVKHPPNYANVVLHIGFVVFYGLFTFLFQICGFTNEEGKHFIYWSANWIDKPTDAFICFFMVLTVVICLHFAYNYLHSKKQQIWDKMIENEINHWKAKVSEVGCEPTLRVDLA